MDNEKKQASEVTSKQQPVGKPTTEHHSGRYIVTTILVLLVALLGGVAGSQLSQILTPSKTALTTDGQDGNKVLSQEENDTAAVAKRVSPSIVSIVTGQTQQNLYTSQELEGAGTGMIVSSDGYVMTNKHVVKDAERMSIIASDGTEYTDVKYIGVDPLNDIAFLKINKVKDLPTVTLGDSGSTKIGQKVMAIGNSLGQYQNTVTSGIISGKGRPVAASTSGSQNDKDVEMLSDLIQTDAAINPGNSGGPLLNMSGQVVGINTAVVSDAQSVGFSIPINAAKGLLKGVLDKGEIHKAYLGVAYINITPEVASSYKLSQKVGAYIHSSSRGQKAVQAGGPAEKAGLKDGDIITKVNDKTIGDDGGLASLVAEYQPGDKLELTVYRKGKTLTKTLTLGEYR